MRITIEDVAKMAKVSITTVSRVINGNYPVKETTRVRVQAAIDKLEFKPNSLARGLIIKKTLTIGVVVPSITNLFFPQVVKGIEESANLLGYTLFLCETNEDAKEERTLVERLFERQVDGIILIGPTYENVKNGFLEDMTKKLPVVLVNGYNKGIRCHFVISDEEMGTREALQFLYDNNHRKIAFVRGGNNYSYDVKQSIFEEFMENLDLEIEDTSLISIKTGNSVDTVEMAREVAIKCLKNENRPTAFFCCNDWMAIGVMNAIKASNLQVGKDVSVIGFDNIVISKVSDPKLTTVDQNMHKLGNNAWKMLKKIMETKAYGENVRKIVLETKLIKRETVSALD